MSTLSPPSRGAPGSAGAYPGGGPAARAGPLLPAVRTPATDTDPDKDGVGVSARALAPTLGFLAAVVGAVWALGAS